MFSFLLLERFFLKVSQKILEKIAISYPDDTNCEEKKKWKKKIGTFKAAIMYWQRSQEVHFVTLRENRG